MARSTPSPARIATLIAVPAALLAGLLVFWLLGGFGGRTTPAASGTPAAPQPTTPVSVAAPALNEPTATVCRALIAHLPDALRDHPRRPVTAGSEQNAAYGDPPIVLSCGTAGPAVPPDAQLLQLSGVCWYPEQRPDGTVWSAVGRQVPVLVAVPKAYQGPSQWVIDFSPPVAAAVPQTASAPANC
jgi:hypothetical protein